jgi:hypothetical protein
MASVTPTQPLQIQSDMQKHRRRCGASLVGRATPVDGPAPASYFSLWQFPLGQTSWSSDQYNQPRMPDQWAFSVACGVPLRGPKSGPGSSWIVRLLPLDVGTVSSGVPPSPYQAIRIVCPGWKCIRGLHDTCQADRVRCPARRARSSRDPGPQENIDRHFRLQRK